MSSMAKAALKDLPPGAAQRSSTFCPGCTPAIRGTSRAAGSCTSSLPSRKGASVVRSPAPVSSRQPGTQGWGVAFTPQPSSSFIRLSALVFRGLTCTVKGGVSLFAARNASVSSRPKIDSSRFTSHLGWLYRMERYFASSRSGMGGSAVLF